MENVIIQEHLKERVMNYQHKKLVDVFISKEKLTEQDAEKLFNDLKQFLFICGTTEERCAPTSKIDIAWHHFILFTRDYAAFCNDFFGAFIHHNPGVPKSKSLPLVVSTSMKASQYFGELSENWKIEAEMCRACDDDCDGCDKGGPPH